MKNVPKIQAERDKAKDIDKGKFFSGARAKAMIKTMPGARMRSSTGLHALGGGLLGAGLGAGGAALAGSDEIGIPAVISAIAGMSAGGAVGGYRAANKFNEDYKLNSK